MSDPTIDEMWFVFETVINMANSQSTDTVDLLAFTKSYDKSALRDLDYERWNDRVGRAAKALAQAAFPILGERGLAVYSNPDDIPTLQLTKTAFVLYQKALATPDVFMDYLNGNIDDLTAVDDTSADDDQDQDEQSVADDTTERDDTIDEMINDYESQQALVTNGETEADTDTSADDDVDPPVDESDQGTETEMAGDDANSSDQDKDAEATDEDSDALTNAREHGAETEIAGDDADSSDQNAENRSARSGGNPLTSRRRGGGRQTVFDADKGDAPPAGTRRRRRSGRTLSADDLADVSVEDTIPGRPDEQEQSSAGAKPSQTAAQQGSRQNRAGSPFGKSRSERTTTDASAGGATRSGGRSTSGFRQGRGANDAGTGDDNAATTGNRRRLTTSNRSTGTGDESGGRGRPRGTGGRQTFGARRNAGDDSDQSSSSVRGGFRRRLPRDSGDTSETPPSGRTSGRASASGEETGERRVRGADLPDTGSGPRRRVTNSSQDLRPRGPRARAKEQAKALKPKDDEDVQIVPLPNGEDKRFSKAVLDRLIEEHGSLTNVINWYMSMQESDDATDEE